MILVTGGAGHIGSHTCVALAKACHDILILDNLANTRVDFVDRLEPLYGKRPAFVQGDIRDAESLDAAFATYRISAVFILPGSRRWATLSNTPLPCVLRQQRSWQPLTPGGDAAR